MKVLLVEDTPTMRFLEKAALQGLGIHDIDEAGEGQKAMELLKLNKYDLVMTDWLMPKVSGIELLRHIKTSDSLKHIPVIMLTVQSSKDNISEAIKSGVDGYLIKPISPIKLKNQLFKTLKFQKNNN